jgi:predicted DNA-binding protein
MSRDAQIMVRVRPEIRDKFKAMADARGITMSAFASFVIGEYVYNQERFANPVYEKLQDGIIKVVSDAVADCQFSESD